jgi:hypothetical protein
VRCEGWRDEGFIKGAGRAGVVVEVRPVKEVSEMTKVKEVVDSHSDG